MITPVLGWLSPIFRAASRPSISGIRMSTRAMSGSSLATRSTSSCPFAASPTTSIPSAMSRYLRSPCRTSEWPSAIATRIVTLPPPAPATPPAVPRYLGGPCRTSEWSSEIATRIVTLPPPDLDGVETILYGRWDASEDVVPVEGQDREDREAGRTHDQRRRSWDPEPREAERPPQEAR